jgi:ribose 5-phosphate isomerase B
MTADTVALAADHAGFELKNLLNEEIRRRGIEVLDLGTHDGNSVDYPDMAGVLAAALSDGRARRGVLVCGTGIGISIAANRHRHVRAALCHDVTTATLARQHNDANVLVLGARVVGPNVAVDSLAAFLDTAFEGGRHQRRVEKLG